MIHDAHSIETLPIGPNDTEWQHLRRSRGAAKAHPFDSLRNFPFSFATQTAQIRPQMDHHAARVQSSPFGLRLSCNPLHHPRPYRTSVGIRRPTTTSRQITLTIEPFYPQYAGQTSSFNKTLPTFILLLPHLNHNFCFSTPNPSSPPSLSTPASLCSLFPIFFNSTASSTALTDDQCLTNSLPLSCSSVSSLAYIGNRRHHGQRR